MDDTGRPLDNLQMAAAMIRQATNLIMLVPPSRETSISRTKLDEAHMWVEQASKPYTK